MDCPDRSRLRWNARYADDGYRYPGHPAWRPWSSRVALRQQLSAMAVGPRCFGDGVLRVRGEPVCAGSFAGVR